jgi:hypothetical protein
METNDDLKKYFDSKEYATAILGGEEKDVSLLTDDKISTLISLLTDPANKDIKEEALITLKKEKGGDLLLAAIASPKSDNLKHLLVAACWESEINFSKYLPFFILLAISDDYLISIEAVTTIENMEGPFDDEHLKEGIKKVKEKKQTLSNEKAVILNDLTNTLERFLRKDDQ